MNIAGFSQEQTQAVLDLMVLAMYADGHLALAEDVRLQRFLTVMGFETDYDRQRQLDDSITRVRQHTVTAETAHQQVVQLARLFATHEHKQQLCELLEDMAASDGQVALPENQFLSSLKGLLRM